jgi:hypothetical protein
VVELTRIAEAAALANNYSIQRMEDDISTIATAGGWPKRWQADAGVRQE